MWLLSSWVWTWSLELSAAAWMTQGYFTEAFATSKKNPAMCVSAWVTYVKRGDLKCQHGRPSDPWWLTGFSRDCVISLSHCQSRQQLVFTSFTSSGRCGCCNIPEVLLAPVYGAGLWLCACSTPCVGANKALEGPNLLTRLLSEDSWWFSPDSRCPCKASVHL